MRLMMRRDHVWITMLFVSFSGLLFGQCNPFETVGSAVYNNDGCIQMTSDSGNLAGCAWQPNKININQAVDLTVIVNFGTVDSAGDGICMVFQNDTAGTNACGDPGDFLGVSGIQSSFIIEFDTRQSPDFNDPVNDHVAIDTNGVTSNPLFGPAEILNIEDGQDHTLRFTYDPTSQEFFVYVDGAVIISATYDISSILNDSLAIFGYTASTGQNGNTQLVCPVEEDIEVVIDAEICQGDSILFNGTFYDSTGTYSDTLMTTDGCDSIVTLVLVVNPLFNIVTDATICGGDTILFNGTAYTETGTYSDTLATTAGCDSILILNLTVNPSYGVVTDASICTGDTLIYNGVPYTESGTYSDTFLTVDGCDSILVLNLIVNDAIELVTDATICEGDTIVFNGTSYTESGTYSDTVVVDDACDTIFTLNLNVTPGFENVTDATICEGDTIIFNGTPYSEAGTYSDTLESAAGCDSILILNLTVGMNFEVVSDITLCEGDTIVFNGVPIGASGSYSDTFMTVNGCDSIFTLNLTLLPPDSTFVDFTLCTGDTININGTDYSMAGTFTQFFESSQGCDSFVIVTITEFPSYSETISAEICTGDSLFINGELFTETGVFTQSFETENGCDSILTIEVISAPPATGEIDVAVVIGNSVEINGETFSQAGTYTQNLASAAGCDSILTINLIVMRNIVFYDLNACHAITDVTNNKYDEFTPEYPQPLNCTDVNATNVYRENPDVNRHSCAPGVDGSIAMCVSTLDSCSFVADDEKAIRFDITVSPDANAAVQVVGLAFFERAPVEFTWIGGDSGPNNYPTLYGVRVLKNGTEVFRAEDVATTHDWTQESFSFLDNPAFVITETTTFSFELLGYCQIANGAAVAAWDVDNVRLLATCTAEPDNLIDIAGIVQTENEIGIEDVEIKRTLLGDPAVNIEEITDETGNFIFIDNLSDRSYQLRGYKSDDPLNGVSTYDLALIQRHILGIKALATAYNMIAADVNGDATVDILDVVFLRKLILGSASTFPDDKSWLFINKDQPLNQYIPWNFEEYIFLRDLKRDFISADFVGVKLGDINGDVRANDAETGDLRIKEESINLQITDRFVTAGQEVSVDVRAEEATDLVGFQVAFDIQSMTNIIVTPGVIELGASNFAIEQNHVGISWSNASGISVNKGDILFTISAQVNESGLINGLVSIDEDGLTAEAYPAFGKILPLTLETIAKETSVGNSQHDLSISPNPASDFAEVLFTLEHAGNATITLYDAAGKEIWRMAATYGAGANKMMITRDQVSQGGVYHCQLQTETGTISKRIVFKM